MVKYDKTFFAKRILGIGNGQSKTGWLFISKSRAGNAALWKYWFLQCMIPTLNENRLIYNCRDSHNEEFRQILYTDGELIIIKEAFDKEVLDAFADAKIDYVKGAPSATATTQSCDVSKNFRDVKSGIKYVVQNSVNITNPLIEKNVKLFFNEFHQNEVAKKTTNNSTNVTTQCVAAEFIRKVSEVI